MVAEKSIPNLSLAAHRGGHPVARQAQLGKLKNLRDRGWMAGSRPAMEDKGKRRDEIKC